MVKTVGEAIGVTQSPLGVFDAIAEMQAKAKKRADELAVQEFVAFVDENDIDLSAFKDDPIILPQSDDRWKAYVKRHPEAAERVLIRNDDGELVQPVTVTDTEGKSDSAEVIQGWYRAVERGDTVAGFQEWLAEQENDEFEREREADLGEDIGDFMDAARRRAQEREEGGGNG